MRKYHNILLWFSIFVFLLTYKFFFHEFWKDEWQAWLVVRDMSFIEMLSFLNYEGHPSLWYLYLKPFTLFASLLNEELLLNIAHSILGASISYLVLKQSAYPKWIGIILCLSYFLCFEYGIINRGYALLTLLAFVAAISIKKENDTVFHIALFLLCQTEIYGVFMAFSLVLYQILKRTGKATIRSILDQKSSFFFLLLGTAIFVFTVYPRGNADDFGRAYMTSNISLSNLLKAWYGMFSNVFAIGVVNDIGVSGYNFGGLVLSLIIFFILIYVFKNDKKVVFSLLSFLLLMFLFSSLIYGGGVRQYGHVFIYFVCILMLYRMDYSLFKNRFFIGLLIFFPAIHNIRALFQEINMPFSNAKETGQYIEENIPMYQPIVGINKFGVGPAAAYANRTFYELPDGVPFTWFKWLQKVYLPTESELVLFAKYKRTTTLFIVSPNPLPPDRFRKLQLIKSFNQLSMKRENFYLYRLDLR